MNKNREETVTHIDSEPSRQQSSAPLHHQSQVDNEQVVHLRREDFRNFLITSKDLSSQQHRISSVDDLEGETVITGGEGENLEQESQGQQNNTAISDEENKFNTFGRKNKLVQRHIEDVDSPVLRGHKSLPRPMSTPNFGYGVEQYFQTGSTDSPVNEKNLAMGKRPISQTYSIPQKQHPNTSSKKNIITNPNAMKGSPSFASALGAVGKKSKQAMPLTTKGYFANGHFYDPNPMPMDVVDGEVYAPGSNYSDHSNIMSTFLGDLPRSRTPSSSNHSEDGLVLFSIFLFLFSSELFVFKKLSILRIFPAQYFICTYQK